MVSDVLGSCTVSVKSSSGDVDPGGFILDAGPHRCSSLGVPVALAPAV